MFYKLLKICIDAPKIKMPIKIAIAINTFFSVLFVFFVFMLLFVFVSTNMRTFEQTNVNPMLTNRYQIVKDKFNIYVTLKHVRLQDEHERVKM